MAHDEPQRVLLAHGGGGQLTSQLIRELILPNLKNEALSSLGDSACLELASTSICLTTDSYVVKPLFFHGGDIGKLAVCGTINDLAVAGSRPVALTLSLIVEEGFEMGLLERILQSIGRTARENRVSIVTGDTKTVERGSADGVFINTAGIGIRLPGVNPGLDRIAVGDKILINGTIGDHGMTIISQREGIRFESQLVSDCAALADLTCRLFEQAGGVKFMRDATRGGLAAVLNEMVEGADFGIEIRDADIPVKPSVQAAADMLGFDVLNIANEGKFVAVVSPETADACLSACRDHPLGRNAALIGEVVASQGVPLVELRTKIGGKRIVQMPYGRELPRIC
ncbi:MAG: hydrogenase expression/formation protein HypE [Sedimentisphaerales bacterium]|jgi:hydrogenase expression/formation protein HypE|nr:hydrogenase expression/formation protein HypE [Sedimentisphaerales bacterium]